MCLTVTILTSHSYCQSPHPADQIHRRHLKISRAITCHGLLLSSQSAQSFRLSLLVSDSRKPSYPRNNNGIDIQMSLDYLRAKTSCKEAPLVLNLYSLGTTTSGLFVCRTEFIIYLLLSFIYVYIKIYLGERDFKELALASMETSKSKI